MITVNRNSTIIKGRAFGFFYSYELKNNRSKKISGKKFKEVMKGHGYVPATMEDKEFLMKNLPESFEERRSCYEYYDVIVDDNVLYCHVIGVEKSKTAIDF